MLRLTKRRGESIILRFIIWFAISQTVISLFWFPYYFSSSKIGTIITWLFAVLGGGLAYYSILWYFYKSVIVEPGTKLVWFSVYYIIICCLGTPFRGIFLSKDKDDPDKAEDNKTAENENID